MGRQGRLGTLIGGAAAGASLIGTYVVAIRPRLLTWGATAGEADRTLPGDELVHHSDQGSQYTDKTYQQLLEDWGIQASMNGVGTW